ncbi:terpenoid synthase [Serendipita vermifera]|nr:terpenoid synthase [Serendipita vermifera]
MTLMVATNTRTRPYPAASKTPRSIILAYLSRINYKRLAYPSRSPLEEELIKVITSWQIPGLDPYLSAMVPPSAAMGEMSYHHHPLSTKLLISLFTFFMIYIDDRSGRGDPTPFASFQRNYALSIPQIDPVLDHFARCLRDIWDHYDTFSANAIVASALEFVNGCYLENITTDMQIDPCADRYPYFLRSKTGVAQAYTFMMFPKAFHPSPIAFIQAAPSISYWIDITNDILSFHKEELAQETGNYVHLRAAVESRKPIQIVSDLALEALRASASIESTLHGDALHAWLVFKTGYITFHISQDRYKLSDLAL